MLFGTLPGGISLSNSGVLSGTPNTATNQTFTVRAIDANGCAGTINYTLAPACPTITSPLVSLAVGTAGSAYSQTLTATGGNAPYTWAVQSGTLPAGLILSSGGVISGTPTASNGTGVGINFKATDNFGCTGIIPFTLRICPVLAFTPATLPAPVVGSGYSQTITASQRRGPLHLHGDQRHAARRACP